ncbi:ribosomal protein S16 domain-containing protein [Rhizoctonia solani]|nr:ribosomal protein S16 domain-containing protein [Rhizoctonia solani]
MSIVRLRLARHGQRNRPFFHIVAINAQKARDAKPIEKIGEYDPIPQPRPDNPSVTEKRITWDADRIRHWLGVGAQPSPTVARLLEMANLIPEGKIFKGTTKFRELNLAKATKNAPGSTSQSPIS